MTFVRDQGVLPDCSDVGISSCAPCSTKPSAKRLPSATCRTRRHRPRASSSRSRRPGSAAATGTAGWDTIPTSACRTSPATNSPVRLPRSAAASRAGKRATASPCPSSPAAAAASNARPATTRSARTSSSRASRPGAPSPNTSRSTSPTPISSRCRRRWNSPPPPASAAASSPRSAPSSTRAASRPANGSRCMAAAASACRQS